MIEISRPALLVWQDREGGRLVALAPPPGQAPKPLFRLTSLGAHMLALALAYPVTRKPGELVPVDLCAKEGPGDSWRPWDLKGSPEITCTCDTGVCRLHYAGCYGGE